MPKLNVAWRQSQSAASSLRTVQRLLFAGPRRYRTVQRPNVFYWFEEPDETAVPAPRRTGPAKGRGGTAKGRKARPNSGARSPSAAKGRAGKAKPSQRKPKPMLKPKPKSEQEAPSVDAPAEAFNEWLARFYGGHRR